MNNNFMEIKFPSLSQNEGLARVCVASFCLQLNPSVDELTDIKTAVSEAVTNCVVHAYPNKVGEILLKMGIEKGGFFVEIIDNGVGINDIKQAKEPFFTTKPDEDRSGMGFAVMESFMDECEVFKNGLKGTKVVLRKKLHLK